MILIQGGKAANASNSAGPSPDIEAPTPSLTLVGTAVTSGTLDAPLQARACIYITEDGQVHHDIVLLDKSAGMPLRMLAACQIVVAELLGMVNEEMTQLRNSEVAN